MSFLNAYGAGGGTGHLVCLSFAGANACSRGEISRLCFLSITDAAKIADHIQTGNAYDCVDETGQQCHVSK